MLSIIVPAYNEEQRLPATLVRMRAYLADRGEPYEVLVVDDGSSDKTLAMARAIAADWPELQVLALEQNTGKGAAVRFGMLSASGEHRIFSDADLSTPMRQNSSIAGGPVTVCVPGHRDFRQPLRAPQTARKTAKPPSERGPCRTRGCA